MICRLTAIRVNGISKAYQGLSRVVVVVVFFFFSGFFRVLQSFQGLLATLIKFLPVKILPENLKGGWVKKAKGDLQEFSER